MSCVKIVPWFELVLTHWAKTVLLRKMKRSLVALSFALFTLCTQAQVHTPPTSTKAESHQVVGLTDIKIDYSRPNMRGRLLFGDLVP